jgi:osmotically-inducible protein OsmY
MKTSFSLKALTLAVLCAGSIVSFSSCAGTATKESTGEFVDDTTITAKVKTALIKDEVVKAHDVNVETFKGTVQLSGFVDNATQKTRAGEVAGSIVGVREVKNNLAVK